MKMSTLLLSGLVTVAGATMISGQVHAADLGNGTVETGDITGKSKVTAVLTAPTDGGTVKLTQVPNLDFGTKAISDTAIDLPQVAGTGATDDTLSVSDTRGTGAGYTVGVKLSGLLTDETHTLTGTTLNLKNLAGASANGNTDGSGAPASAAELKGQTAANLITAGKDQGLGNWNYKIADSNLNVLPGAFAGNYAGQLTWTLAATDLAGK